MCKSTDVIRVVLRAATSQREEVFAWVAIDRYLKRILDASEQKLISYGMRPFVTPIAVELAIDRAAHSRSFTEYLALIVEHDGLVAELVLRGLMFYAQRFAGMSNEAIQAELKTAQNVDMNAAAIVIQRNLQFIQPS